MQTDVAPIRGLAATRRPKPRRKYRCSSPGCRDRIRRTVGCRAATVDARHPGRLHRDTSARCSLPSGASGITRRCARIGVHQTRSSPFATPGNLGDAPRTRWALPPVARRWNSTTSPAPRPPPLHRPGPRSKAFTLRVQPARTSRGWARAGAGTEHAHVCICPLKDPLARGGADRRKRLKRVKKKRYEHQLEDRVPGRAALQRERAGRNIAYARPEALRSRRSSRRQGAHAPSSSSGCQTLRNAVG